jgi:hypothetical protein
MNKEKLKNLGKKTKPFITYGIKIVIVGLVAFASFHQGKFTERHKNDGVVVIESNVTKVNKDEVNIAIDESNNLIIIDNESGKYTIYQDSIGQSIFKLYARNIWGGDIK